LLLLTAALRTAAQDDRKEKIEALKIGFITQELDLTPDEAQKFWPVYNRYEDELKALRKSRKTEMMNMRLNIDSLSDAEVSKAIDNELSFQQQEVELRKKYVSEFRKVLPTKKVARLLRAEQQFKLKLLQEVRDRRDGPRPDGPRQGHSPRRD
ncbi:MAG TPA: Spy/CpxP family protein refolding chaperone, partial [Chitinophagales bacterium]|nr:Spy/CpxP family protein refolding chaperone [Chitinophagales bacterium]